MTESEYQTRVAFDLDGCIFYNVVQDFNNPLHVQIMSIPDQGIVDRIKLMESLGMAIYVVTGRSEKLRFATLDALDRAGLRIPSSNVHMQEKWAGMDALIEHKAQALLNCKAEVYVGDQEADERASIMAGCHFMYTPEFRFNCTPHTELTG